jgi:hypothetical protein
MSNQRHKWHSPFNFIHKEKRKIIVIQIFAWLLGGEEINQNPYPKLEPKQNGTGNRWQQPFLVLDKGPSDIGLNISSIGLIRYWNGGLHFDKF